MTYVTYQGKFVKINNQFPIIPSVLPSFDLIMTFDDILNAPVGDPTSVSEWNTWFDLPTYGNPFTGASVNGDEVTLSGGSNINLKPYLFGEDAAGPALLSIQDTGSVVSIDEGVFSDYGPTYYYGCPNLAVASFSSLNSIGTYAFADCFALTSFNITASVNLINDVYVFSGCTSLTDINVDGANPNYSDINGVLFNKLQTNLIIYPAGKTNTSYTVPGGVTNLSAYAFGNHLELTDIVVPATLVSIEEGAFSQSGIIDVSLYSNLVTIGDFAFGDCPSLYSIIIPNSVTNMGSGTFSNSGLNSIILGTGLTSIGNYTFGGCANITTLNIPNNIIDVSDHAFDTLPNLTTITGGGGIISIGISAFQQCSSLDSIESLENLENVGKWAFRDSLLQSFYLPNLKNVADQAFEFCNATDISIGNNLETVGTYGLGGLPLKGDLLLPNIILLGNTSFQNCSSLNSITIGNLITSIGTFTFSYCSGVENLTIGNSVTTIGIGAFGNLSNLTNITIPSSVTTLDSGAFQQCTSVGVYNFYPLVAPSVQFNTFLTNPPAPLHIQSSGTSGYDVLPWTDTGIFSSIIADL